MRPAPAPLRKRAEAAMKALVDVAIFGLVPLPVAYIWNRCGDDHISPQRVVRRFNATTEEIPLKGQQDRRCFKGRGSMPRLPSSPTFILIVALVFAVLLSTPALAQSHDLGGAQ